MFCRTNGQACCGEFLSLNVALEFTGQYQSVIVFGKIHVLEGDEEKRRALSGLISKYYPAMTASKEYRPITDQELKRTSVYAIATLAPLQRSAGRELERHAAQSSNWPDEAEQSDEWPNLE